MLPTRALCVLPDGHDGFCRITNERRCDGCAGLPAATIEMHVCESCSFTLVQSGRRQDRLAQARVLLEILNQNGLTPYRDKIRDWLKGSD